MFPDEYHLHTLDQLLSAIARLNPHVDLKKIVIGLMDRLSTFAQRETDTASTEDKQKAEEEATIKLLEKVKLEKETKPEPPAEPDTAQTNGSKSETPAIESESQDSPKPTAAVNGEASSSGIADIKLFEIFHDQVLNLVKTRGLSIQDTMALLTSLANLAL